MKSDDTICPVCEGYYFEFNNDFDICPICGWENDGVQRDKKDYWGGANSISVNEAKVIYSLLQNEATKSKVSQIIDKYEQREREIHTQYAHIDHRTSEGEKCSKAFAQAHNDFISELYKLLDNNRERSLLNFTFVW